MNYTENDKAFEDKEMKKELGGHPIGLFMLFFMEMWERFSFYGMKAILVLFLIKGSSGVDNPGMGWSEGEALWLYGWYNMLVYFSGLLGGYIGDLAAVGQKNAIRMGCFIQMMGHFILVVNRVEAFYSGLLLIVVGCGLLKPNISILVGMLYPPDSVLRDQGFTIFYIGINIGAFVATLLVGYVGETINWHLGFVFAALGMLCAQLIFFFGESYIVQVDQSQVNNNHINNDNNNNANQSHNINNSIQNIYDNNNQTQNDDQPLTQNEKDRIKLILLVYIFSIIFWAAFEQGGGLITIFISQKTRKEVLWYKVPASWFQALNPLFIIILGQWVSNQWLGLSRQYSELFKMGTGIAITGGGFIFMVLADYQYILQGYNSMLWIILTFLFHTIGELCFSPVTLAFITRLSPPRYQSKMMGTYLASTGIGAKLAGYLGQKSEFIGTMALFQLITSLCFALAALIFFLEPKFQHIMNKENTSNSFTLLKDQNIHS